MALAAKLLPLLLLLPCAVHVLAHTSTDHGGSAASATATAASALAAALAWTDGKALVQNSGWNASVPRLPYARLPLAAKTGEWCSPHPCPVRAPVLGEGMNGAGLYLAFKTDATSIVLNATLIGNATESVQ